MTLNPFRPGAGHTPPEFAGRQEPLGIRNTKKPDGTEAVC